VVAASLAGAAGAQATREGRTVDRLEPLRAAGHPTDERLGMATTSSSTDSRSEAVRASLLVAIKHALRVTARPGGGRAVGVFPATSRYYHVPLVAWIMRTTAHGRFGRISLPYSGADRTGWIDLRGLSRSRTPYEVRVDLSRHLLFVERTGRVVLRFRAATGASESPTPTGRYFVTDRVPFPAGSAYGTFAFGISGIQTRLPPGWTSGDQLAIHGTNDPSSIGTSASAGCVRVSEAALAKLRPLLRLGTPVVIVR
jgi:hypothetical protein